MHGPQICSQQTYTRLVDTGTAPSALTTPPPAVEATRPGWPRLALAWVGAVTALGLLMFAYHHLAVLAEGGRQPVLKPLVNEMTGAFTGGIMFLPVLWLVRRFPLRRNRRSLSLLIYAAAVVPFGVASTSLMWGLREALYPLVGLGDYDYGVMPLRYLMELPLQVIVLSIMVGGIHAADAFRAARERAVHTAMLETSLARAQLHSLRLRLQPHFLFNALNTVSSTMHTDPDAADEILERLAELLRASLRSGQTETVPIRQELKALDHYVAIMRARFGDRLRVDVQCEAGLDDTLVPAMVLQPLVENAVRHGGVARNGSGTIQVRVQRRGERLLLEVGDDGPGAPAGVDPLTAGLGLSATAERLRLLYGDDHRFTAGSGPSSGFVVQIELPLQLQGEMM